MPALDGIITRPCTDAADTEMTSLGELLLNPQTVARMPAPLRKHLLDGNGNLVQRTMQERVERHNCSPGRINEYKQYKDYNAYYDCPKCLNRGDFAFVDDDGNFQLRECSCMAKREALRNMYISGLSGMLTRYRLDNWQCREPWQRGLLDAVTRYAERPDGWFVASGTPGTGKTHICTVLCNLLMERGFPVRYMLWRDFAQKAKAVVNDAEAYDELVTPFLRVRVLYVDDFFKAGRTLNRATGKREPMSPTEGDVNLAWKIINTRYNNPKLLTIISTEMSLGDITGVDEALGSRIVERARDWYCDLRGKPNWRLT